MLVPVKYKVSQQQGAVHRSVRKCWAWECEVGIKMPFAFNGVFGLPVIFFGTF